MRPEINFVPPCSHAIIVIEYKQKEEKALQRMTPSEFAAGLNDGRGFPEGGIGGGDLFGDGVALATGLVPIGRRDLPGV
jgi:hypothetical protein